VKNVRIGWIGRAWRRLRHDDVMLLLLRKRILDVCASAHDQGGGH
jgi:hypothetical protein